MIHRFLILFAAFCLLSPAAFASAHTEGGKKILVLVSQYPDESISKTEAQLQADFDALFKIGQTGGIDEFYRRNSYGKTWIESVKVRKVTLPNNKANYAGQYNLALSHALSASGESSSTYDRICSVAAGTISSTGLAYVGGTSSFYNSVQGAGVFVHELGHNWGNWHANFWKPNGTDPLDGTYSEYGNKFDNMAGTAFDDWNSAKKLDLDFLTTSATDGLKVLDVFTSGTYRLTAFDSTASAPGANRSLRLSRTGTSGGSAPKLFIDYRQVQQSSNLYSWNGVHLYIEFTDDRAENLLDTNPQTPAPTSEVNDAPLLIGRTFFDPGANVYITPLAKVAASNPPQIDVRLNFGPISGNTAPVLSVSASNPAPAAGSPVTLTATATDANGDTLACAWDFGDGTFSNDASSAQTKTYATAGWYRVACTVTDMRGGTATQALWINVGAQPNRVPEGGATVSGLSYRYYEGAFSTLPDFGKMLPKKSGTTATVDISPRDRNDNFAFLFEGYIDVPSDDVYQLTVKGDDGFRLYLGDTPLIASNTVKNSAEPYFKNIGLAAGKHRLRLEYFHKDGAEELSLAWRTANSSVVTIPAGNLAQLDSASNPSPSVTIDAPAPGSQIIVGGSVQFLATATDADGIARVQYFTGSSYLGESTTAPYSVTWNDVSVGTKTVTALAYDTTGRWTASTPVVFEVVSPDPRQSIGINFTGAVTAGITNYSDLAGAVYQQGNWNNITTVTGNSTSILDSLGSTIGGLQISWNGVESNSPNNADASTANGRIMKGMLKTRYDRSTRPSVDVSGVPYREYDVYVYSDLENTDNNYLDRTDTRTCRFVMTPTVGTAPAPIFLVNSLVKDDGLGDYPNYDTWVGFKEATGTSLTDDVNKRLGNYVVFRNQTASSFSVRADRGDLSVQQALALNAIQIVEVIPTAPRIYLSTPNLTLSEGGAATTYSISLGFAPTGNLTVSISPDAQITTDKTSLTFTPENWATPQFVTVRAVDDSTSEASPHTGTISHAVSAAGTNYSDMTVPSVTASITDNDQPAIIVQASTVPAYEKASPVGTTFTFSRAGAASLTGAITVNFTMSKPATAGADLAEYTLSGSTTVTYNNSTGAGTVLIPSGSASATITLTPVDDSTSEGYENALLTLNSGTGYAVGSPSTATVSIRDDEKTDWLTQYFSTSQIDTTFDLTGKRLTFTPDAQAPATSPYRVTISDAATYPTDPAGHVSLESQSTHALTGNNSSGYWTVTSGFPVKFFGTTYNTLYIGVDGWLRFSGPSTGQMYGIWEHFPYKQIAAFFTNLDASPSGADIFLGRVTTSGQERTVITWNGLWLQGKSSDPAANQVSVQLECWDNGTITLTWTAVGSSLTASSNNTIVGLANGSGSMPSPTPGSADLNNFSLAPSDPNRAPVFNTAAPILGMSGSNYTYPIAASDADGTVPALSAPTKPAWLTLTDHGNGTATLAGTPPSAGSHAIVLRASDGTASTDQSFTLVVEPAGGNTAPVFTSVPPTTSLIPGSTFTYSITTTDANGQTPAITAPRKPAWLTLTDNGDGTATLTGTVPSTDIARFDVEVAANDGFATTAQAFAINLDRAPVVTITSPARHALELPDRSDTLVLEAAATDPEGGTPTVVWSVVTAPSGGAATFGSTTSASTTVTFSAAGRYRLRLTASDGTSTAAAERDIFVETNADITILQNGLLAHWPADETAGLTRLEGASGTTTPLFLGSGTEALITTGGVSGQTGDNAVTFGGNTGGYAENLSFTQTAKTSLSFWIKPAAAPASADQVVLQLQNGGTSRLRVSRPSGSSALRVTADFGTTDGVWDITGNLPANTWTHVVIAYDYSSTATNPVAYLNGTSATVTRSTAPSGSLQTVGNRLRLGADSGGGMRFAGMIDEVRAYQEIVTAAEVTALNSRSGERTANLSGYWKFDDAVGSLAAEDGSGNNYTLTLGSGTAAVATTSGYSGNAFTVTGGTLGYAQATVAQPNQLTVALWFRTTAAPATAETSLWTVANGTQNRLRAYRPANDRRLHVWADWGTTDGVWRIEEDIPADQWKHVTIAYDRSAVGNTPVAYLDGRPVTVTTVTTPAGTQQNAGNLIRFGANAGGGTLWTGRFDEIRLHNRIVPADEIPLLPLPNGVNAAPDVTAGTPIEAAATSTITLAGDATDDGAPNPPAEITYEWILLSGPAGANFGSASSPGSTFTTGSTPGTYTLRLAASDGEATVHQSVTVTVPTPPDNFTSWIAGQSGANGQTAATDDPDADGIPNLLEYALGGAAGTSDSSLLPAVDTSADHLTLTFTPQRVNGLTYTIEASDDLSDWTDQTDITSLLTPGQPHTHTDSETIGTRRFLRLTVSQNP